MKKLFALVLLLAACSPQTNLQPQPPQLPQQDSPRVFSWWPHKNASVAHYSTLSEAQASIAGCTAADGSWRCASARPKTFMAASSTPIRPAAWSVPNWFVDPQNTSGTASDSNNCTASATACRTWAEIAVHRLGFSGVCAAPLLNQVTTITYLSSHTTGSDPMLFCPVVETGGYATIQGTTPTIATSTTITRVSAKSTVAGANTLLTVTFAAGSPAQGGLVQNTTTAKSSRAWIYKNPSGSNWNMTQPFVPQTLPATSPPTELNTWNTGDTVNLLTEVAVNIVQFAPTLAAFDSGFDTPGQLYQLNVFDPAGAGSDYVNIGSNVVLVEALSQRIVFGINGVTPLVFSNSFALGGNAISGGLVVKLVGGASLVPEVFSYTDVELDGDTIMAGSLMINARPIYANVYIDGTQIFDGCNAQFADQIYGGHVIYGNSTANLSFQNASHGLMKTGSYTSGWTAPATITGVLLNGSANGSCGSAADPSLIHTATTSVAHLDAACGAGTGLGSKAFNFAGASVSNAQ